MDLNRYRMMRSITALIGIWILTGTGALHAQAREGDEPEVLPLDELVVTATRTETQVRDVPVNVTVVTRDQIRLSPAKNLHDLLQEIPGFGLFRETRGSTGHPSWQAVGLRGLAGSSVSRTLVLVDGVPLNDPFFGWVRWSQIPLETIERVELLRGGGSVAWGSRGLGGVINVITRSPSETSLSLSAQGGSHETFQTDGTGMVRSGRFGITASGEYFDSEGYSLTREDQRGDVDIRNATQSASFNGKLEYEASPSIHLFAQGSYLDEEKVNATVLQPTTVELGVGRLGAIFDTPDGSRVTLNGFANVQTYTNALSSVDATRDSEVPALDQWDVPSTAIGTNLQWERPAGAHGLSAGVDYVWVEGEAFEDFLWRSDAFERRRHTGGEQTLLGIYLQDEFRPADDWLLIGGVRVDRWKNYSGFRQIDVIATGDQLTDAVFEDRSGWEFSHNLGLRFHQSDRMSWRGSFYGGLRVPSANELYKPFRRAGGVIVESNELLDPEKLLGFEIGADYQVGARLLARVTGFWAEVRDAILEATIAQVETSQNVDPCGFVPAGGACQQRTNIGTLRTSGVETELEYRPAPAWRLVAAYTFNPTEVVDAPGREDLVGNRGVRTPVHTAALRLGYSNPSFLDVTVAGRYLGKRFEDDVNAAEIDDSFVVDVRLGRQVTRTLSAFATIENLFDTPYEISRSGRGFVRVGGPFTVNGGLRVRLGPVRR
jgi:outer membrane receptor protein involved in Fe transport